MTSSEQRLDLVALAMGLAFVFMWSSAFTSARLIVADASPLWSLSFRFALMGVIAVGIARAMGQSWHLSGEQWRSTMLFGVCQNALYLGLNFVAMQTVEAGLASIIASTMPLLVAALGWLFWRERMNALAVAGLWTGFAGVAIIMGHRLGGGVDLAGVAMCVVAAVALAVATLLARSASAGGNVLMVVGLQGFVGSAVLGVVAALFETPRLELTSTLVLAFSYTLLVPGLLATWVWFRLLQRIGPVRAATFHFLNPFFGVATAWLLLGEQIQSWDWIGVAVVMIGILAVQLSRQRP